MSQEYQFHVAFTWPKAPDHSTIARFRSVHLSEALEDLFYQMVKYLHRIGEVNFEHLFVDGTKIEANANRYTFVWKKAVDKNQAKMYAKIQSYIDKLNQTYTTEFKISKVTLLYDLKTVLAYLEDKARQEHLEFVHGIGKKKSNLQKFIEEI